MTAPLDEAIRLASRGWWVFPCRPRSKAPDGRVAAHGHKEATADEATIRRWWTASPTANIGIACRPSRLLVVDVDPRNGGDESLRDLVAQYGPLPPTVEVVTGSGGRHIYFRAPAGVQYHDVTNLGGLPGIDVKANGYVVAPPSVHPSGRRYAWEASSHPDEVPLADPPAWLLALLAPARPGRNGHGGARIPPGLRNTTLASIGGSLRRRGAAEAAILAALLEVNRSQCDPPLDEPEVQRIAASVARYAPADSADDDHLQSDYGHAAVLAEVFRGRYRWAPHRGWLRWTGQVWRPTTDEAVAKAAADALRTEYLARLAQAIDKQTIQDVSKKIAETCVFKRITGSLNFLKGWPGILTEAAEWDRNPWLFNLANGTLDLRDGTLKPHDPNDLITKLAPVAYRPDATGDRWQRHLARFLPNSNIRRQVQRDLGVSLIGATVEEHLPIWFGTGANGKTTTSRALMAVLGDYADRAAPNLLIERKHDRHPTELADLAGKRLVFSVEIDQAKRLAEGLTKSLTGGDRQKARFMHKDFFSFEATATIVLIVNHKPVITGTDWGIWRRVRLIPWEVSLPPAERRDQETVVAELVEEGPAILNWLLGGLYDWQQNRAWAAPEVQAATDAYRAEMDILADFIAERCILKPTASAAVKDLYDAYVAWCSTAGEEPVKKKTFTERLRDRGIVCDRTKERRLYRGIGLRHDAGPTDTGRRPGW